MTGAGFLRELWRGAPWAYLWTPTPDDPEHNGKSLWFRTDGDIPDVPADWRDTYFAVHPCKAPGSQFERTGKDAWRVGAVNAMYADFDAKHFADGLLGIMAHLDTLPLYPSAIVATGGGVHCYWIFSKPIILTTPRHKETMARAQRLWVDAVVHSDPSAKDLARVLRLPDTLNHKYSPARVVEVIDGDPVRRWHDAERIAEILRPAVRQDEERQAAAAEAAKDAARNAPYSWRKLLEWALTDAQQGHRHKAALRLAGRLKEAGAPQSVAEELVGNLVDIITDRPTKGEAKRIVTYVYG